MSMLVQIVKDRLFLPKDTKPCFAGRTIIVTGANTGLGFEAAAKFVQSGASRVILGVRTISKGEEAKKQIEARIGCREDVIHVWLLDMLDYESIRAFAKKANNELQRLDIVCLNAGISPKKYQLSAYGWESTLQIVGSSNHQYVNIREEARTVASALQVYNTAPKHDTLTQYNISKLFVQFVQTGLVNSLSSDQNSPPINIVVVCPGPVKTELARDFSGDLMMVIPLFLMNVLMFKTPEQGARTYISGAALGDQGHGRFWQRDEIKEPAKTLTGPANEKLQEKVWREVVETLRKDVPEVDGLLSY